MEKISGNIAASNFDSFKTKINNLNKSIIKLNKKANKELFPNITYRIVSKFKKKVTAWITGEFYVDMYKIELDGVSPKLGGYSYLAKIEHNIVSESPNDPDTYRNIVLSNGESIHDEWFERPPKCDHCELKRKRKVTFLLKDLNSGEIKQVGDSCIDDFLGHTPLDYLLLINESVKLFDKDGLEESDGGIRTPKTADLVSYVSACIAAIKSHGWVPMSNSSPSRPSTSSVAWMSIYPFLLPKEIKREDAIKNGIIVDKYSQFEEMAETGISTIKKENNKDTNFNANLTNLCYQETIGDNMIGMAAVIAKNILGATFIDNKKISHSTHFGKIGDSTGEINVTITDKGITEDGKFGTQKYFYMEDTNGNLFVTYTTSIFNADVGDKIKIIGIVKSHTGKETKRTILKSVKIIPTITAELLFDKIKKLNYFDGVALVLKQHGIKIGIEKIRGPFDDYISSNNGEDKKLISNLISKLKETIKNNSK